VKRGLGDLVKSETWGRGDLETWGKGDYEKNDCEIGRLGEKGTW